MPRPPLEEWEIDEHFKQALEVVTQYDGSILLSSTDLPTPQELH